MHTQNKIALFCQPLHAALPESAVGWFAKILPTPLGEMVAVVSECGVALLEFVGQARLEAEWRDLLRHQPMQIAWQTHHWLDVLEQELAHYFSGSLKTFSVPVDWVGTDFQKRVWRILQTIPYGETISYAQQAQLLGNPRAVRAVAAANGRNKISIIVPCHRVIGSNGTLTGYAGGLARKQFLLDLETRFQAA